MGKVTQMLREALIGSAAFLAYYVAVVIVLLAVRRLLKPPGELVRKLFHISVAGSMFVPLHLLTSWQLAAGMLLGFGVLFYIVISWAGRYPRFMRALHERHPGEVRSSLALMFFTMAVLFALGWGWLDPDSKFMVVAPIMGWGFGDAAAALVGKKWGRHRLSHPWVDNKKTTEGTIAMVVFAAAAILVTLIGYTAWPWYACLLVALLVAPVTAVVELVTRNGLDTVTVPLGTFTWLLAVVTLLGRLGVL